MVVAKTAGQVAIPNKVGKTKMAVDTHVVETVVGSGNMGTFRLTSLLIFYCKICGRKQVGDNQNWNKGEWKAQKDRFLLGFHHDKGWLINNRRMNGCNINNKTKNEITTKRL